jgi:hypothetical protein
VNLEEIEQRCFKYLMETSTPLVPVETLWRFLLRKGEYPGLTEQVFIEFLRHHELFRVIEPLPLPDDPEAEKQLSEAGFRPQPRVVLCTRLPSAHDLKQGMLEELAKMLEALGNALQEAIGIKDKEKVRDLRTIIRRAEAMAERIDALE